MKRLILFHTFMLWALWSFGAEIQLVPEPGPYEAGEWYDIGVQGATLPQVKTAFVTCYPREGAKLKAVKTWADEPILQFRAKKAGQYLVLIAAPATEAGKVAWSEVVLTVGVDPQPPIPPTPPTPPIPPPDANPYTATAEYKAACGPLSSFRLVKADAVALADLYARAAAAVLSPTSMVRYEQRGCEDGTCKQVAVSVGVETTADLRAWFNSEGPKLGMKGKYAKLPDAMEQVMAALFGRDIKPLDKPKTAAALNTIAWFVWETGK